MKTYLRVAAVFACGMICSSLLLAGLPPQNSANHATWDIQQLEKERDGKTWYEFFRSDAMYSGLYVLQAGARDGQSPHPHDELYYVLQGSGKIALGQDETKHDVQPGSVIFVKAKEQHRFYDIKEDLHLLVFFSTANTP